MGRGECKLGILGSASYQQVTSKLERGVARWGNKSGIWRFYRRVWKNIFYEKGDKERGRGVLGWEEGRRENLYFFKNFQKGGEEFEIL